MAKTVAKKSAPARTQKSATKAAPKTTRKQAQAKPTLASALGLPLKTWISSARKPKGAEVRSGSRGFVFALAAPNAKLQRTLLKGHLAKWQLDLFEKSEAETQMFHGSQGPVWIIRGEASSNDKKIMRSCPSTVEKSDYARFRDAVGAIVPGVLPYQLNKLILEFHGLSLEAERGALLGLELASYSYSENRGNASKPRKKLPTLLLKTVSAAFNAGELAQIAELALATNIARHYVNVPGGELNPKTYTEDVVRLFSDFATVTIDVWEGDRLQKENMNLLLAVGAGATEGPRLVHFRYRPKVKVAAQPIAIVGKGITFDSGGLDLKPSSAMRWMKKDMGGSAAAVGLAYWAASTALALPLDIYLSIAENAVSGASFRPGDIITSRAGITVEIDNTDAEGRLVLADALDVAVSQTGEHKPQAVINIATLTGAIKVGLGNDIAGLFSNDDELAYEIECAGGDKGDLSWRMPLFQPYRPQLRSSFADVANSGGGMGGAITAALFLEMFVKHTPWAHLDIYAWREGAQGALTESGGNGQPVQALAHVLTRFAGGAEA